MASTARQGVPLRKQFALWLAHGRKCQYCKEPLSFKDLWVEHIIPHKLKNTPQELSQVLSDFGLPSDFDIDSYENWLSTHHYCNRDKGGRIPDKSHALHFIGIAKAKAKKARQEEDKATKQETKETFFTKTALGIQGKVATRKELNNFLDEFAHSWYQSHQQPFQAMVVSFSLAISDVGDSHLPSGAQPELASLCDWLEEGLIQTIKSVVSSPFHYSEASERNGETLSVRLVFLDLDLDELERFRDSRWTISDISYFPDIYDEDYWFEPLTP